MSERKVADTVTKDGARVVVTEREGGHANPIVDIASTISKGELPRSEQLEQTLRRTKEILDEEQRQGKLDEHGKKLARDVENVLASGERILKEKGRDEILQELYTESRVSAKENIERGRLQTEQGKLQPEMERMQETGRELYDAISNFLYTLVKSGDFRHFMVDSLDVFKALLTDLQISGSEKLKEGQLKLEKGEQPQFPTSAQQFGTTQQSSTEMQRIRREMEQLRSEATPSGAPITGTTTTRTEPQMRMEQSFRGEETKRTSDELFDRYCNLFSKASRNPDYQRAVDNLFTIFGEFQRMKEQMEKTGTQLERTHSQRAFDSAYRFIETFTGTHDLKKFTNTFNRLWDQIKSDESMKRVLNRTWEFNKQVIRNPEYLQDERRRREGKELHQELRDIMTSEKYRIQFNKLFQRANDILDDIRDEETVVQFQNQANKFLQDFAFDKEGKPDLWVLDESFHDLKLIIIPLFKKHLEDIPIDKVEIFSDTLDARIEGLLFSAAEALPEDIKIKTKSVTDIGMKLDSEDRTVLKVKLQALHFRPHFKQLKFFYRRKTFPKIEDYGVADVDFAGEGMDIFVNWKIIAASDKPLRARLTKVKCTLDKLNIQIKGEQTKHAMLDKFVTSMMNHRIKRKLCQSVAESLEDSLSKADHQINTFFENQPLERLRAQADARLKEAYERGEREKGEGKTITEKIKESMMPTEGRRSPVPAHRT